MTSAIENIIKVFDVPGKFLKGYPYGNGHINDSFAVEYEDESKKINRYMLQRINQHVFTHPDEVMKNIIQITAHLRLRIMMDGGDADRETLTLISARDGRLFTVDEAGDYWRLYLFIEGAETYELPQSEAHVISAGKAIGRFQRCLSDFPVEKLAITIPDFHHTPKRFTDFKQKLNADRCKRVKTVTAEIDFVLRHQGMVTRVMDALESGELPLRVTNNDAKLDNIMIDVETNQAICVIDLDTVMPGSLLFDFGDAIRSMANTGREDEPDLEKVHFDLRVYRLFTQGYLSEANLFLTPMEKSLLAFSARLITFEQAIRFLGDYLDGDRYYKINHPRHNLDRARTQLRLVEEMEAAADQMEAIVASFK